MSNPTKPAADLSAAIKSLKSYLLEKGHRFERGQHFETAGKTPASVADTAKRYEGMGYTAYMKVGNPPVYVLLGRGHQEVHIFQPQDPQIREWLEDEQVALNNPAIRAHLLQTANLSESELPVARAPQVFRITEMDGVFIITSEDAHQERKGL